MPGQLPVPEDLFDTVQWNTVQLTLVVMQVECKIIVGLEENLSQWHTNNAVLWPARAADPEFSPASRRRPE
jgi:hypothetical protein